MPLYRKYDNLFVQKTGDTMTGQLALTLAGVGLSVTQDSVIGGYVRAGSLAVPNNTTAGDFTALRLSLGNSVFNNGNGRVVSIVGTSTGTASQADIFANFSHAVTPINNSSTEFRALQFQNIINPATGITFTNATGMHAGFFENRVRSDGQITTLKGITSNSLTVDSSSPAAVGVSTIYGFIGLVHTRPSGTTTTTLTTGITYESLAVLSGAVTATTIIGFRANNSAAGQSITTNIGFDVVSQTRGSTNNYGIRIAQPALGTPSTNTTDSIALVIPASSPAMSDQVGTTTNAHGISVGVVTYTSTTNARVITNASSLYISGAPIASTNITITNGPYSMWIDSGTSRIDGNIDLASGSTNIILGTATGVQIGTGTNQKLGFYGTTPVVQQTDGTALTNNMAASGTTNQINDFTNLTLYSTDAQTIHDNIYQLARKVKLIDDALRTYGLLS